MQAYERLIKYTAFPTASHEENTQCPSSAEQLTFAAALADEMRGIGIEKVRVDENGYVYGEIPANCDKDIKTVGFIAHMDVVEEVPYTDIKPQLVKAYDGGMITLNKELGITMSPEDFPVLVKYIGHDLVTTDGTTLLGADDKAGIAEILTFAEMLINDNNTEHGRVAIAFTPDEEIGRGADKFDIAGFGADFAYTADGDEFGEVTYENFNAASADITVNGFSIHPGEAKNKMKNALRIAMEFDSMLPYAEKPEYTEKYEGFYHLNDLSGTVEKAHMLYILRDHDLGKLEEKKKTVERAAAFLNERYGENTVVVNLKDAYRNMAAKLEGHRNIIEIAYNAVVKAGGDAFSEPMRGGTDGAVLSYKGLICPNLGTASHNHHGKFEFASVQDMERCAQSMLYITYAVAEL